LHPKRLLIAPVLAHSYKERLLKNIAINMAQLLVIKTTVVNPLRFLTSPLAKQNPIILIEMKR